MVGFRIYKICCWTTKLYTFIPHRQCIFPFTSPPTFLLSLLPFLKKHQKQDTKTSAHRNGSLKNQPNKMGMTPQHFQTIPTSCVILPTMYTTKLSYMHTGLFTPTKSTHQQGTQHCSFHSLLHTKKKQYLPCSAATKVHNITDTPTHHTDSALLMYSTLPLHTRQP